MKNKLEVGTKVSVVKPIFELPGNILASMFCSAVIVERNPYLEIPECSYNYAIKFLEGEFEGEVYFAKEDDLKVIEKEDEFKFELGDVVYTLNDLCCTEDVTGDVGVVVEQDDNWSSNKGYLIIMTNGKRKGDQLLAMEHDLEFVQRESTPPREPRFSMEKYLNWVAETGWAKDCDGLTKEELDEKGLYTSPDWME
jgi:hypothetical protein